MTLKLNYLPCTSVIIARTHSAKRNDISVIYQREMDAALDTRQFQACGIEIASTCPYRPFKYSIRPSDRWMNQVHTLYSMLLK